MVQGYAASSFDIQDTGNSWGYFEPLANSGDGLMLTWGDEVRDGTFVKVRGKLPVCDFGRSDLYRYDFFPSYRAAQSQFMF